MPPHHSGKSTFPGTATIAVDFTGTNPAIRHTPVRRALKIKDAIVDRRTKRGHVRPDVDKKAPGHSASWRTWRQGTTSPLDLTGPALHSALLPSGHRRGAS